jgi:hypothetical protein
VTPHAETTIRRMAAIGYLPSEAVLRGLGVKEADFVAVWADVHRDRRPERETVAEALLTLTTEVTGEEQRRMSSALFALTQAVFDRGDVALPESHVARTLAVLRDVQRLDLTEDAKGAGVLDAAIRRLGFRELAAELGVSPH